MNSMTNLRPSYDEFEDEADQLDELYGEFIGNDQNFEIDEYEWENEIIRKGADLTRWIQQSLNKILGLNLKVDGIIGPKTRSSIRSFQQHQGLVIDGIVGPITRNALVKALTGNPVTPRRDGNGNIPDEAQLAVLRAQAKRLIDTYVPSDTGDPKFTEIAQDFGGVGTTCGFLCHWLLWRLGCRNQEIVNRKASGGFIYRIGQNISRIWNTGRHPFLSTYNNTRIPDGASPRLGDIVFIMKDPKITTGKGGEHVFVFLKEISEGNKVYWISADAGQKNAQGKECARIVKRQFVIRGRTSLLVRDGYEKIVMGWLPLSNLSFGSKPKINGFQTDLLKEFNDELINGWESEITHQCFPGEGPPAALPDPEGKGIHPLIYRGTTSKRSRNPTVGYAQSLLNRFLKRITDGSFPCMPGANVRKIEEIERTLTKNPLKVDCRFGPDTEKATLMFQHCVFPNQPKQWDKKIGSRTWEKLELLRSEQNTNPPNLMTESCYSTFTPAINGFRFGNFGPGLCGGMTFLAADYHFFNRNIPADISPPSIFNSLYAKIWKRQIDSVMGSQNGPKFAKWSSLPDRSCAERTVNELQDILAFLCNARLFKTIPIGLVIARNQGEILKNHQVLVYGAEQLNPALYLLRIYDPNHPLHNDIFIEVNIIYAENYESAKAISSEIIPGREPKPIRGFFRLMYTPEKP